MSTAAIVGVVVAVLFLVAVLAVIMLLEYRRRKRPASSFASPSSSGQTTSGWTFDPKAAQVGEAGEAANSPQLEGNPTTAAVQPPAPAPAQARIAVRRI